MRPRAGRGRRRATPAGEEAQWLVLLELLDRLVGRFISAVGGGDDVQLVEEVRQQGTRSPESFSVRAKPIGGLAVEHRHRPELGGHEQFSGLEDQSVIQALGRHRPSQELGRCWPAGLRTHGRRSGCTPGVVLESHKSYSNIVGWAG